MSLEDIIPRRMPDPGPRLGAPHGVQLPPLVLRPGEQSLPVTNVRGFGALGNGLTDDTRAIQDAIDATLDGESVYFPVGTYLCGPIEISHRSCLKFMGDGPCSVIKRAASDPPRPMLRATDCANLEVRDLTFEADGFASAGGEFGLALIGFYRSSGVHFWRTTITDAQGRAVPERRRNGPLGLEVVGERHQIDGALIHDCSFSYYGIHLAHARRSRIYHNVINTPPRFGIWVGSETHPQHSDIEVSGNTILDAYGAGIAVADGQMDDPEDLFDVSMERIRIVGNTIRNLVRHGYSEEADKRLGIFVGAWGTVRPTIDETHKDGPAHKDIWVADNVVLNAEVLEELETRQHFGISLRVEPETIVHADARTGAISRDDQQVLRAAAAFERAVVAGNTVQGWLKGIQLSNLRFSQIAKNRVAGCLEQGFFLGENFFQNLITGNTSRACGERSFLLDNSLGKNVFMGNSSLEGDLRAYWGSGSVRGDGFFVTDETNPPVVVEGGWPWEGHVG